MAEGMVVWKNGVMPTACPSAVCFRARAAGWLVGGIALVVVGGIAVASGPDFSRDVRPILSNRCFKCHGPDESHQEAGLRLDRREAALAPLDSGARAIVPGRPDDSALVARVLSTDPDLVMPPPDAKTPLRDDEKQLLARWVASGADYRPHWAFVAPERPAVAQEENDGWSRTDIDRIVRRRLAEEGLVPSPEADRATLCRRVSLDLIGLPPSPADLDAFLADNAADAYERLVDRLLASPRYGERWARRWLDLARYADTNGYEKDRDRSIWPWRDWVIRAINDDMPFDAFTIRQIAGDLLPDASVDDIVATGFHRNTMINEEGGIDPLEYRYLAMVDRVGTTGATWLGLTMACAQCHTHKFDPITHTDFFATMALLDNVDEPEWTIPSAELLRHRAQLVERIDAAWQALPAAWPTDQDQSLVACLEAWEQVEAERAVAWHVARPAAVSSSLPSLTTRDDGSVLAAGDVTKSTDYTIMLAPAARETRAIRLEALPDESLPDHGPGMIWYEGNTGDFFLSEFEVAAGGRRLALAAATQSFAGKPSSSKDESSAAAAIDGDLSSGWSINGQQGRPNAAVFQLEEPVPAGSPLEITLRFERHYACPLGCFRLSVTADPDAEARGHTAAEEQALATPASSRTPREQQLVERRFLASAPPLAAEVKRIRGLEDEVRGGTTTLVMKERPPAHHRITHRHHRGEFTQPKEEVRPATPAFLPPLPAGAPADRLALARWLVARDNPLTARVVVNRHWQAFFGRGIVTTLDDFGFQGDPPSHPDLLDWLAVIFMDDLGWSTKKLHRLIVMSAVYRQASAVAPALAERDPGNVLLARGPRVRLDAEVIRDSLLSASGLLSSKMYGPGVRPPQPAGVTEVAYGNPTWKPSTGEDRHRRSIYTLQKRTAPFAMAVTFDGPTGEACVARRDVSNSPLQALTLLNDEMFLEMAQALGAAVVAAGDDDATRLRDLGRRLLSREFDADERRTLEAYLIEQRRRLAARELDAAKLAGTDDEENAADRAAWTLVARVVMNLDEAIVKR